MLHWQYNKLNRVDCLQLQEILRGDDIETQVGFLFFFQSDILPISHTKS